MTFKKLEQTCREDGFDVLAEKTGNVTTFTLRKIFSGQIPPLTLSLSGATCAELVTSLERIMEDFDTDRETYRHLNTDGHGRDGFPPRLIDVYKSVRYHKDEIDRLLNDCRDTLLPAGAKRIPTYEFRRRTKEMLKKCFDQSDRLIERTAAECGLNFEETPEACLLPVSATKAILKWMGENFGPGYHISYSRKEEVLKNEKQIFKKL